MVILILNTGNHRQGAGGLWRGPNNGEVSIMVDYAKDKQERGNLEELLMHESAHACLDHHMKVKSLYSIS